MKRTLLALLGMVLTLSLFIACDEDDGKNLPSFVKEDMKLVWNDEFDNDAKELNPDYWSHNTGGGGWGNNEVQVYTEDKANSYIEDGKLNILASKDDGGKWTSARLTTRFKQKFQYGYIEMRAKLPTKIGCWPAFWMLPQKSVYGPWPRSGEIDIMEASAHVWGKQIYGTLHCLEGHAGTPIHSVGKDIGNPAKYHNYAVYWTEDLIRWYYDGEVVSEYQNPKEGDDNWKKWPYDNEFFILMNLAIGGNLGGEPPKDVKEYKMQVDYVRIYQ